MAVLSAEIPEGVGLARKRRAVLAELIKVDPERAIALTVPASIRTSLPPEVVRELETRVSGIGELSVVVACPAIGGPPPEPIQRTAHLGNQDYRAFVYGRRADQTTKIGVPLHGVAIGDLLALAESCIRELEPGEVPNPVEPVVDLRPKVPDSSSSQPPILGEAGNTIYRFASRKELIEAEAKLEKAEAGLGPHPRPVDLAQAARQEDQTVEPDGWTAGNQNVLIIRVDFSDLPGDPVRRGGSIVYTAPYVQNFTDTQITPYYQVSSYGITTLTNTAATPLYRMPHPASFYATLGGSCEGNCQLHADARTAAAANYTLANYDRMVVLFSWLGDIPNSIFTYGGRAQVGGPNVWVNGEYDFRVVAHELGHTYGLYHAGLWQVTDGNPISPTGQNVQYGDDFDTMGANFANDTRTDFNPYYKNIIGWIPTAQIQTVTTNGTYRINRFDFATNTGTLGVKVVKDGSHTYWIGCRRSFTNNNLMQHGAYIIWGYGVSIGGSKSDLLDLTTPGNSDQDAALAIGSTFTDTAANLQFLPVGEGGTGASQYVDVQVNFLLATPTPAPTSISISGAVAYCSNPPDAVPSVTLTLTGTASSSVSSNGSGNYTFSSLPSGGSYTVTPAKAALVPGAASINTVDVLATQRQFLEISPLAGCRLTAADANQDSAVTTVDVLAIQRFFLGFTTGTANVGQYKFTPANRTYAGVVANQTNQNYDALVFGDAAAPFAE